MVAPRQQEHTHHLALDKSKSAEEEEDVSKKWSGGDGQSKKQAGEAGVIISAPTIEAQEHVSMGLAVPVPRHRQRGRWGAHPCTNEVWHCLGALTLCTAEMRSPRNEERLSSVSRNDKQDLRTPSS
jgi:hypothetical protein